MSLSTVSLLFAMAELLNLFNSPLVLFRKTIIYLCIVCRCCCFEAAKRKAVESVLKAQFYLLIQQFSVNPEKVARMLYGISVIDLNDLAIATSHLVPELDRGKVLAVTLVRRLRRWPDPFGEVCKVLIDIPAMQEANGITRCEVCGLLYVRACLVCFLQLK